MLILPVFLVSADIKDKIEYDSINVVIKDKNHYCPDKIQDM